MRKFYLFFSALFFSLMILSCTKKDEKPHISIRDKVYNHQTELHSVYKLKDVKIVMLGNSITQGVNWNELLSYDKIANRGISRDITSKFLLRLDNIISISPKYCFIMGGINDLYDDIPVETVFANYSKIVNRLIDNNIIPVIQSTLFVSPQWKRHIEKNEEVAKLNSLLKKLALEKDLIYLNVNSVLSDGYALIDEYTTDGVHLNAEGYKLWGAALEKIIFELDL
ncbi:MAG: GDSL family lipase [Ignavibacteriae bacterium]|nr:GDSL family lipase [Ignavibacteriota bacterium]NOG99463.1 GDSL family lipase [Ignavibacteriota bacterium]